MIPSAERLHQIAEVSKRHMAGLKKKYDGKIPRHGSKAHKQYAQECELVQKAIEEELYQAGAHHE